MEKDDLIRSIQNRIERIERRLKNINEMFALSSEIVVLTVKKRRRENKMPKQGDLKVWHIPQVPMKAFEVPVKNIDEAILVLHVLANYDIFQFKNKVKPDYCNVQGLIIYDENFDGDGNADWVDWQDLDGNNIDDIRKQREAK